MVRRREVMGGSLLTGLVALMLPGRAAGEEQERGDQIIAGVFTFDQAT